MKLLNVRLSPEDARRAAALRKDGVPISSIVREAIRAAYERRPGRGAGARRASAIMAEIYREHPDPPDGPRATRDLGDRAAVRRAIRTHLARRRP